MKVNNFVKKILPLAILYFLLLVTFLGNSDYESLIVLVAAIPLIIYIFTNNADLKKYLQYVLYLFIAGIVVYWITSSYGVLNSVLYGYFGLGGFSCFFTGCHGETGWNLFTQSALFTVDLKILFYLAIIFLSIKNKNREWIAKS